MTQPDERLPEAVDVLRLQDGDLVVLRGEVAAVGLDLVQSLRELSGKDVGVVVLPEGGDISAVSRRSLSEWMEETA